MYRTIQKQLLPIGFLASFYVVPAGDAEAAFVGDLVYCDVNANGVYDEGDYGLDGVGVSVTCQNNRGATCSQFFTQTGRLHQSAMDRLNLFPEQCGTDATWDATAAERDLTGRYLVNVSSCDDSSGPRRCTVAVNLSTLPTECNVLTTPRKNGFPTDGNGDGDFCDTEDGPFPEEQRLGNTNPYGGCEAFPDAPPDDALYTVTIDPAGVDQCNVHNDFGFRAPATPGINIESFTNGNPADAANDPDVPQLEPGAVVVWTYEVTNTGDVPFSEAELVVTDDRGGSTPALNISSDDGGDQILSPQERWDYIAQGAAQTLEFDQSNTVPGCHDDRPTFRNTARAEVLGFSVSDSDLTHYCNPGPPGIDIRSDLEGPDTRTAPAGASVTFEIVVSNTGTVDLRNVLVTDEILPDCANDIGFLAAGTSVSYPCTIAGVTASLTHQACARGESSHAAANDCDPSTVEMIAIDVRKQEEGPDTRTISRGADVSFEIVVTNAGDEALVDVAINDPLVPACTRFVGDLAAGAHVSHTCSALAVDTSFTSEACVTGQRNGITVSDCDPAAVEINSPGGQGCTPGYWKQKHHFDSWVGFVPPGTGYGEAFAVGASFNKSLLKTLRQGGGGESALGRHAVAALLNARSPDVDYAFTASEVISIVQAAYASGNFEAAKARLEAENERGCPLN